MDAGGSGAATVWSVAVDSNEVTRWFGEYLDALRRVAEARVTLVRCFSTTAFRCCSPTATRFGALTSDDQVVAAVHPQVEGMRAAAYARTEITDSEITVLNSASALYRGTLSRQRSDGSEISRLTATIW